MTIRTLGAAALALALLATVPPAAAEATATSIVEDLRRLGVEPLPGLRGLQLPLEDAAGEGENVIGYLPASNGELGDGALAILVGARHDDNHSGVAALLSAAEEIAAAPRDHAVVLAFWSGNMQGLVGSVALLEAGSIEPGELMACVNLDAVGGTGDNRLDIHAVGSSPAWRGLIERANVPVGFDLHLHDEPVSSTDAASFLGERVPAVTLTTEDGADRGGLTDSPEKPDSEELKRVGRFTALLVLRLDRLESRPEHVTFRPEKEPDHPPARRAYTGTIPDYAAEVRGLRLSGVIEGGPAEQAGLAEGDVIVEFAGRKIDDIYDYGDALDTVVANQPIQVVFIRGQERHEVTVTPTGRP